MEISTLVAGVLSSLIAVGLLEGYLYFRRLYKLRTLKCVLALHGRSCTIIAPIHKGDRIRQLIHYRDAYAFGHLFALCNRLKTEPKLLPFSEIPEILDVEDSLAVGGPLSNEFVKIYLRRYVPGFRLIYANESNKFKNASQLDNQFVTGFRIGDTSLLADDDEEYAILIKLSDRMLDQHRTIHLIFGYSARGTAAAAYLLWQEYPQLYRKFGISKYCVAVPVSRTEGYKVMPKTFVDLTTQAFPD